MTTSPRVHRIEDLTRLLCRPAIREVLAGAEASGTIPEDLYRECAEHGLFALSVPEAYGGLELGLLARTRLHALVARASASLQSVLTVHEMVVHAISRFGRPELRDRWLREMSSGRCLGAFALTEPAGGSDFEQVATTVEGGARGLRLNGTKCWVSSGLRAGVIVVFAVSGDGPLALVIPRETEGLTVTAGPAMSAFRAASLATLRFRDCPVGPGDRLGPPGLGLLRVATASLGIGRVLVATGALAVAAASLEELIAFARGRTVGRQPLAAYPLVRKAVADAHVRIHLGRLATREAAVAVDVGAPQAAQQAIVAKLAAAEAAVRTTQDAVRLHGAAGLTADSLVLRQAAEARVYETIEGGTEALASALGGTVLRAGSDLEAGTWP